MNDPMVNLRQRTLWESLKYALVPSFRRECDENMKEVLRYLVAHPEAPCVIGGEFVPNGFGAEELRPNKQ